MADFRRILSTLRRAAARLCTGLAVWWCLSGLTFAAGPEAVVRLVDGNEAVFRGGSANGRAVQAGGKAVAWRDIEAIVWKRPVAARIDAPVLFLVNGDKVRIAPTAVDDTALSGNWADLPAVAPLRLPLEFLRGGIVAPARDERRRAALWRLVGTARGKQDRILLRNGDEVAGELTGFDGREWRLGPKETDAVPENLTQAVILSRDLLADSPKTPSRLLVRLAEGSTFTASDVTFTENTARCQSPLFGLVELPLVAMAEVRPLDGRVHYLSDWTYLSYQPTPYLTREWPLGRDEATTGTELVIGETGYSKGVGLHAPAELSVTLNGALRFFAADVGLAPEGRGGDGATIEVEVDGEKRLRVDLDPQATAPVVLTPVQLAGAKRLTIRVDSGAGADILDHAVLGNARLVE